MKKSHLELYVLTAALVLVVGFIAGIAFGASFPRMVNGEYDYNSFNSLLMFEIWGTSILISVFVFGIYSVAKRLDVLVKVNPEYKTEISRVKKNKIAKKSSSEKTNSNKEKSEYNW